MSDADRYILPLDRYRSGDYDGALREASQIDLPNDVFTQVLLAMINGALDDRPAAQRAVRRIQAMAPDFSAGAIEFFRADNFDQGIIDDIAQGLSRAGMELRPPPTATQ